MLRSSITPSSMGVLSVLDDLFYDTLRYDTHETRIGVLEHRSV
jgi:hypothetical protein